MSEPAGPEPPPSLSSLAHDLEARIRQAEAQLARSSYATHRDRVRMELGAPQQASRGRGDCLALALLPLALILLVVHPVPAILLLVLVGWLYLAGSEQRRRELAAIRAADAEAERRWRDHAGASSTAAPGWDGPDQLS